MQRIANEPFTRRACHPPKPAQATPSSAREAPSKAGDWADVITHTGMACK